MKPINREMTPSALGLTLLFVQTLAFAAFPASAQTPVTAAADEIVTIERLTATGSRMGVSAVQFLTGLRPGMKVNEDGVRKAAQRMADSGLVQNVGYEYQSLSSDRSVELEFTISDEMPLLPASIQIPDVDAEDVWAYLKNVNPVFTRELPRTQKALAFYTRYIEQYLTSSHHPGRVATVITADTTGHASGIVFVPASLMGTPQLKGKRPAGDGKE